MDRRTFCSRFLAAALGVRNAHLLVRSSAEPTAHAEQASQAVTRYVSEFIVNSRYQDLPDAVISLGKKSILDGFGLAIAGSASEPGALAVRYVESFGFSGGRASVIGTRLKVPPRFAAFANGISIHANDYDDTAVIRGDAVHATVPVLPPVFAFSESQGFSEKEFLLAYHVGVEVECKISQAISSRHYSGGFHATGTMGSFGSTAACAKLKSLSVLETQYALGIAAAEAAGVRANFGTMAKPFQAGHAAESGVVAADLASLGWTASPNILEAPKGFFEAAGGGFDAAAIIGRLGNPWSFESPGVLIKRFPCGTIQQPVMDEMLRLIRENRVEATAVEAVQVRGSQIEYDNLLQHRPTTGLAGKFSMEFCLAILLLEGKAGLEQFTDATVNRVEVQDMIRRVKFCVDPSLEESGSRILTIRMKDGRTLSGATGFAKGSPQNPMTFEEVAEKFRQCAAVIKWPKQKVDSIIEVIGSLERAQDIGVLSKLLTV
jgi:2-methylcitrate dehydratase PrpD